MSRGHQIIAIKGAWWDATEVVTTYKAAHTQLPESEKLNLVFYLSHSVWGLDYGNLRQPKAEQSWKQNLRVQKVLDRNMVPPSIKETQKQMKQSFIAVFAWVQTWHWNKQQISRNTYLPTSYSQQKWLSKRNTNINKNKTNQPNK